MRRHFKNLSKSPVLHNHEIASGFIELIDDLFQNYRQLLLSGDIETYKPWGFQFKSSLSDAFKQCIPKAGATGLNLLAKLRDQYDQLWYCLDCPEVPPDHNLAERYLRLAVTKRKISGGSRSLERFGDTANLLTIVQTCRNQKRSVIDFLASAIQTHTRNQIIFPSLISLSAT
jgi:transposase